MRAQARVAILFLCLLAGHEAARITAAVAGVEGASSDRAHLQAKVAKDIYSNSSQVEESFGHLAVLQPDGYHSLLERGCQMDDADLSRALALKKKDKPGDAAELGPDEYWSAENALGRCRTANNVRIARVIIGAPVAVVVGNIALFTIVQSAGFSMLIESVATVTAEPIFEAMWTVGGKVFPPLFEFAWSSPLYLTKGALTAIFGTVGAIYFVGGAVVATAAPSVVAVSPLILSMKGATRLTSLTVEQGAWLLGYGARRPSCCCSETNSSSCALFAPGPTAKWKTCPAGWEHDAAQCPVPEVVRYSEEQTVEGCSCKNATQCGTNKPYRGHAWCEVSGPGRCGWRFRTSVSSRWDYCRVDGRPLEYAAGTSSTPNDALATFIPNRFERTYLPSSPNDAFTLGTWVDAYRGITTAKKGFFESSQCFAGTPVETLTGCAHLCLEEGAPNAKTMGGEANMTYPCVAFAYNRALHLCVRLPEFATDAQFTPHLSEWSGKGWQNFVSKYHGRDTKSVCPSKVLLKIRQAGYKMVRDKNNGHLYVQCANSDDIQKVSCIQSECQWKSSWCFVRNHCRSGYPSMFGGCRRLPDAEALQCAGEHGALVPGNGNGQEADYWDASNALARCSRATTIRSIKVGVSLPFLLLIGEAATVNIVESGLYAQMVGNVFDWTFQPIASNMWHVGALVGEPLFMLGSALPLELLQIAYGTIVGSLALVYALGTFVIGISPTAAALVAPIVGSMAGVQKLTEVGVDIIAKLVGYGPRYPMCCCPPTNGTAIAADGTRACALVASVTSFGFSKCPNGWDHDASQCSVPEVVRYSDAQTVAGCQCANFTDCGTNPPHKGHAWCRVSGPRRCGHSRGLWGLWDYCRVDGKPLDFAAGSSSTTNDALATFIPNVFSRNDLLGPSNPFKIGTWTDSERAVTTAKAGGFFSSRMCFAGTPVETLGACAKACLDEGAPSSRVMANPDENASHPCVAFAYHRSLNLCVRLPAFAADARYTPTLRQWGAEGWQNYVSKYYGKNLESSCPAVTLLDIRDRGYAVARDKNNGHLYLRCANNQTGKTQKASCIKKECDGGGAKAAPWCFVENRCRSCARLKDEDPLKC